MEDLLPFRAEYAKSGRAGCKGCKTPILQGALRLAVMVQSPFFDGKQPNWHHEKCFFMKQRPKTIADIAKFTSLKYEDQNRIKKQIESNSSGIVMAAETKGKGKGKKRANVDAAALKDFAVEYSKSSRATCRVCDIKITKGEVRISKTVFDTEVGQKFGGQALWHHVKCFAENRAELLFFAGGELLPGFNSLTKEDKLLVKKEVPMMNKDEVPVKKMKEEPKEEKEETKVEDKEEKIIKKQNQLFFKLREKLESNFSKTKLQELMEYNEQSVLPGKDRLLDHLADCLAFGRLMPCNACKQGQLVLNTNGYKCHGHVTDWTKCLAITQTPDRKAFKIPEAFKEIEPLKNYKYKPNIRLFRKLVPTATLVKVEETKKENAKPVPPLKNLEFYIYGLSKQSKEDIKIKVIKMGGKIVSKLTDNIAAVISTPEYVEQMSEKMEEIQSKDIQVVDKSYINDLKPGTTVAESIALITEKNIASWGSDPKKRIPQDVVDGKSIPKSTSSSMYSKSKSGITKLKVKGGTAVDPDSGLDDVSHVYKNSSGLKYSVVLGLTDIASKKNSFYKLQLLEADKKNKYWVFRSWGRIGTTIGGTKNDRCDSLTAAIKQFEDLYYERTENDWGIPADCFVKQPGRMYPIEIDYGEDENQIRNLTVDTADCKLPVPVQHLIKMIFDVESMKKVMLEFEVDLDKMPLGKLSKKQLTHGYEVLTKLQQTLSDMKISDDKSSQQRIVDFTNKFYTLVPHSFGVKNPPLLDSEESIKQKTEMLDNLLEMEIAYSIMKSDGENQIGTPLDNHYIQLKSEIHPIHTESPEFDLIKKYVQNTHASTHNMYDLEILQMFKVERHGEDKQFKPFRKLPNRRLLWHGSRVTNFAGILSQGLRIAPPEAPVTGYMFGKGIYFADMVSKSANYCCTDANNSTGLMLLCEVALGNMHELTRAEYVTKLPSGKQSVKGIGKTEPNPEEDVVLDCGTIVPLGKPVMKKVQSTLLYNEYIVYDIAQVKVKYLFQMKFNYKF